MDKQYKTNKQTIKHKTTLENTLHLFWLMYNFDNKEGGYLNIFLITSKKFTHFVFHKHAKSVVTFKKQKHAHGHD